MASSDWNRMQLLKRNTVTVQFGDLNPAVQHLIGEAIDWGEFFSSWPGSQTSLKTLRTERGHFEFFSGVNAGLGAVHCISGNPPAASLAGGVSLFSAALRTHVAKGIQQKHQEISKTMKKFGVLQTKAEQYYPPDWLNPTIVAQTHPIFSVRANGDVVFRRVTPLEFKLLKIQEKWRGKMGLNVSADLRKLVWRWRGTLRRPEKPEVETSRVREWLRRQAEWAREKVPRRRPAVAFAPARGHVKPRKTLYRR